MILPECILSIPNLVVSHPHAIWPPPGFDPSKTILISSFLVERPVPAPVLCFEMNQFFTPEEYEDIDVRIRYGLRNVPAPLYSHTHQKLLRLFKNHHASQKFRMLGSKFTNIHIDEGYGIIKEPWINLCPAKHEEYDVRVPSVNNLPRRWITIPECVVKHGIHQSFVLLSNPHRLHDKERWKKRRVPLFLLHSKIRSWISRNTQVLVTMHGYSALLHPPNFVDGIIQDCFLPSAYPFSYLGAARGHTMIPTEPEGLEWFRRLGVPFRVKSDLITIPPIIEQENWVSKSLNLLVALNHAGDWCAGIDRSDTMILLQEMLRCASMCPNHQFRFRFHPTGERQEHEGPGINNRYAKIVVSSGLKNTSVSDSPLQHDLLWSSGVITEYSAVAIESATLGKPIIYFSPFAHIPWAQGMSKFGFHVFTDIKSVVQVLNNPEKWQLQSSSAFLAYRTQWQKMALGKSSTTYE